MHNARKKRKLRSELEQLEKQRKVSNLPNSDSFKLVCCGVGFISEKKLMGHKQLVYHASSQVSLRSSACRTSSNTADPIPSKSLEAGEHSYSNHAEKNEMSYNSTGISCLQCAATMFGTKSAPFICHIFGHIAPPLDITLLRLFCTLCRNKELFGIVKILNHSKVHPEIPFSQIFPSNADIGPIFAYLDDGIRTLFDAYDAQKVCSIIDSTRLPLFRSAERTNRANDISSPVALSSRRQSDKTNTVLTILPNSLRCLRCSNLIGRDQITEHVLHHLDVNREDQAIFQGMTDSNRQVHFKCYLCANGQSFNGQYAFRYALLHSLILHRGVPFSAIFLASPSANLLLGAYLRRIIQCLFASQFVSQVMDIINGSEPQLMPVLTPVKERKPKIILVARPKATNSTQGSNKQPIKKSVAVEPKIVVSVVRSSAINSHSRSSNQETIMKGITVKFQCSTETSAVHALNIMPELTEPMKTEAFDGGVTVKREETDGCLDDSEAFVIARSEMDHFTAKEEKPCL